MGTEGILITLFSSNNIYSLVHLLLLVHMAKCFRLTV